MPGISVSPGDVVLMDVVYTDQTGSKQRPVLAITASDASGDFVAAMLTSSPGFPNSLAIEPEHMTRGTLPHASWIRCDRPLTANVNTIVKPYGAAQPALLESALKILCPIIGCK